MDSSFMTVIVMSSLLIDGDECRVINIATTETLMKTEDTRTVQVHTGNSSPSSKSSTPTYSHTNDEAILTTTTSTPFQINKGRLDGGSYSVINFLMAGPPVDGASNTHGTGSIGIAVDDTQPSNKDRNDNISPTGESDLEVSNTRGTVNTTSTTPSNTTNTTNTTQMSRNPNYHRAESNLSIGQATTVQPSQLTIHVTTTIKPMIMTTIKDHDHMKIPTPSTRAIEPVHVGFNETILLPSLSDNSSLSKPAPVSSEHVGNSNSYTVKATVYAELVSNDTNLDQQTIQRLNNNQTAGVADESTFSNAFPADVTQNNTESKAKHIVHYVLQTPSNLSTSTSAKSPDMNASHSGNEHLLVGTENMAPTTFYSTQSVNRNLRVDNGFQYNPRPKSPIEPVSKSTEYVHRSNQATPRPVGHYFGNGYQPRSKRYGIRNRPREISYGQISYGSHAVINRQYNTPIQQFPYHNTFNHQRIRPQYHSFNNLKGQYANILKEQEQLYRNWLNPSNRVSPIQHSQYIARPIHLRVRMSPGLITEGFVNGNTNRWYRVPRYNRENVQYNQYHRPGNEFTYKGIVQRSSPVNFMWSMFEDVFEI